MLAGIACTLAVYPIGLILKVLADGMQGDNAAPTRKRAAPEEAAPEEDDLPDEVRQRLSALREVD